MDDEMQPTRQVARFTVDVLLGEDVDTSDWTAIGVSDVLLHDGQSAGEVIQVRCQEARLVVSDA